MTFTPENHGFVRLVDFKIAATIAAYEYRNHARVDGRVDLLRLNIYMSCDGAFTTIWNGLIEPRLAEEQFTLATSANAVDFQQLYFETLFRGYLDTDEDATVVLRTLRITTAAMSLPQVLRGAPNDLRCERL
jgi:hypothetical protein